MPATFPGTPSLELPIVLVAPGLGATEAVLEELCATGDCRVRSLRFFSPGTKVEFAAGRPGRPKTHLSGRIAGYSIKGQRFIYQIELDAVPRQIGWITLAAEQDAADAVARAPLARASVRADADFSLDYRVHEAWRSATAGNLSTGGMLMRAHEILVEGMALDLRFTLPSGVLERNTQDALRGKNWDQGVREAAAAILQRPFKELALRARIVCHRPIAGTIGDYGMEFCSVDFAARLEIERYCTAMRYARAPLREAQGF